MAELSDAAPRAVNEPERLPAGTTSVDQTADAAVAEVMADAGWRAKFEAEFDRAFGPAAKK